MQYDLIIGSGAAGLSAALYYFDGVFAAGDVVNHFMPNRRWLQTSNKGRKN